MPIRSVERALHLLTSLERHPGGASLSELGRATGLAPSTATRLLSTLEQTGFVWRALDGRFFVGLRVLSLAMAALRDIPLYEVAKPYVQRLAAETGETANLAVLADRRALYLYQVPSTKTIRHANWVGRTVPLEGTAIGRALTGKVGAEGYTATRKTIEPDVTAIAAPIFGPDRHIVGAINVTAPSYRISDADIVRCGDLTRETAAALSRELDGLGLREAVAPAT